MGLQEWNEVALQERNKSFFQAYKKQEEKICKGIEIIENNQKERIICYLQKERKWRLNSIYHPKAAAELFANRYGKFKDYSVLCIFGLSDGIILHELLKNCNDTQQIIIYEPSLEIFLTTMREFLISDIIALENVQLVVNGINEEYLQTVLQDVINYQNRNLLMQCILPNYDILFPEQCNMYIEKMLYYSKMEIFKRNTEIEFGKKMMDNIFSNLNRILKESSVTNLCEYFLRVNLENIPAIIVSAGPSLDKNIDELKKAEGKAFIIGVDSALKALMKHDIHVDLAISIDFNKNPDVFADDRLFDIPWVISASGLPVLVNNNKNRLFFENVVGFEVYYEMIKRKTGKDLGQLETGGSVATDALSLALGLGFKKIILIGQDLAFTGGKGHVSGFEKSEEADKKHVESREIVQVEAQDGNMIETDVQMESYLRWFEMRIEREKKGIEFYNATEGGAKIRGTIQIPLREAIEKFCIEQIDFSQVLREVPYTFMEKEQIDLRDEILDASEHLYLLEMELKKGIEAYEVLLRLEEQQRQNSAEYARAVKAVTKVNQIEENEVYMEMIKLYAKIIEFDVAEDIYVADNLSVAEIAERGRRLLSGYVEGLHICKERIQEILIPSMVQEI